MKRSQQGDGDERMAEQEAGDEGLRLRRDMGLWLRHLHVTSRASWSTWAAPGPASWSGQSVAFWPHWVPGAMLNWGLWFPNLEGNIPASYELLAAYPPSWSPTCLCWWADRSPLQPSR